MQTILTSFENYSEELEKALSSISEQQKFFFGVWCTEHLYKNFGKYVPEILTQEEFDTIKGNMEFLWQTVDNFEAFDNDDEVYDYVEAVREIDPDESLQAYETIDGGITNLLGSLEDVTSYILQREDELVASGSENIVTVIYLRLTNELGLDDSGDPDEHFDQPMLQEELNIQFKLLEQLKKGAQYTSKDKDILR